MRYGVILVYSPWRSSSKPQTLPPAAQICTCHQLLHPQVLQLLIKLFETEHSQLDVMEQVCFLSSCSLSVSSLEKHDPPPPPNPLRSRCVGFTCPHQLELKKTLLDRMVHLLSRGYVLPVVGYIRKCLEKLNTDISLIRYFVTEVRSAPGGRRREEKPSGTLGAAGCATAAANASPRCVFTGAGCDRSSVHLGLRSALLAHPGERQHRRNHPHRGRTRPGGRVHRCVNGPA